MGLAGDLCLIVVTAWLAGLLCQRAGLPIVLGYIAAGLALSPHTAGPTVVETHEVEMLADIGVALLLFTVGLEFPLPRLSQVGKVALVGAPVQVILTCGWGVLLGWAFRWETLHGLWFGALLSLSSTTVVLRCLDQNGYINTLSARVMIAILVLQDLCSVPILLIMPRLGVGGVSPLELLKVLALGALFVAFWLWMGKSWLPRAMAWVAGLGSREMFSLTVLAVALGIGYSAWWLGLSLAFGAFLAGLVLAESEYSHQAMSDVTPLRDLFTLIFFASVGMLIDPFWVWQNLRLLVPLITLAWAGKALIMAGVVRSFGYANVVPWAAALYMGQMGELAFVIARLGRQSGSVPEHLYQVLVAVAAVSMTVTPLVAAASNPAYRLWRNYRPRSAAAPLETEATTQQQHTIVVGYGRVGRLLVATLRSLDLPVVIVDNQEAFLRRAQEDGYEAVFGECDARPVLEAAGIHNCRNIIFTFNDPAALDLGLRAVRDMAPNTPVLIRAASPEHLRRLPLEVGEQNRAVVAEIEGALEMAHQCLEQLGLHNLDSQHALELIRQRHYRSPNELETQEELVAVLRRGWRAELTEHVQLEHGPWEGCTLAELDLRARSGATVLGILRQPAPVMNPGPTDRLQPGDGLLVTGTDGARRALRELLGPKLHAAEETT